MTEFKIVPSESKQKVYLCLVGIFSVGSIGCIGLTVGLLYHYGKYVYSIHLPYDLLPSRIRKKMIFVVYLQGLFFEQLPKNLEECVQNMIQQKCICIYELILFLLCIFVEFSLSHSFFIRGAYSIQI